MTSKRCVITALRSNLKRGTPAVCLAKRARDDRSVWTSSLHRAREASGRVIA